jgi:hypothetical protein
MYFSFISLLSPLCNRQCKSYLSSAGILEQSMGARNRVGIGLSYQPAWLHRLTELIPGLLKSLKATCRYSNLFVLILYDHKLKHRSKWTHTVFYINHYNWTAFAQWREHLFHVKSCLTVSYVRTVSLIIFTTLSIQILCMWTLGQAWIGHAGLHLAYIFRKS